jgi:perosamine synthetase
MGDGGALVCRTSQEAERVRRLRWLGIDRDTWTRTESNRRYWWQYNVTEIGAKSHLNDIAAAIGLVQLRKLDAANQRRRQIVSMYNELLAGIVATPPLDRPPLRCAWHLYHIRTRYRDDLAAHLASRGICTGVHYYPIHLYPCYGPEPARPCLPVAEDAFAQILTLPLFPDLADDQVRHVAESIRDFARAHGGDHALMP